MNNIPRDPKIPNITIIMLEIIEREIEIIDKIVALFLPKITVSVLLPTF